MEFTTGPLGQGLASCVGMAIALRRQKRAGDDCRRVYVVASDGDLMEGVSQEAIDFAGHRELHELIVLHDDNGISLDGPVSLASRTDQSLRFRASGWAVDDVDGHDAQAVYDALARARLAKAPTYLRCRTLIGFGVPEIVGRASAHGGSLGAEAVAAFRTRLGWRAAPFEVPSDVERTWLRLREKGRELRSRHQAKGKNDQRECSSFSGNGRLADAAIAMFEAAPTAAPFVGLSQLLHLLGDCGIDLVAGAADVATSAGLAPMRQPEREGALDRNWIDFGVREHLMVAAMNGLSCGGVDLSVGLCYLAFTDYARPAIRVGAQLGARWILFATHDSIRVGPNGATHQPVEHLWSLRHVPRLSVIRPADAVELLLLVSTLIEGRQLPAVVCLHKDGATSLGRTRDFSTVECGCYRLGNKFERPTVQIYASGSEVPIALAVADKLNSEGIFAEAYSAPWIEGFMRQSKEYQESVLCPTALKVVIEAGTGLPWRGIVGDGALIYSVEDYGQSQSEREILTNAGLTLENISSKIMLELVSRGGG